MPTKSTTQILILLCLIHSKQVHSIVYKKKGKGGSSDSSKIKFLQKTLQKAGMFASHVIVSCGRMG